MMGLSPRVRGNRTNLGVLNQSEGSIPARAGEPDPKWKMFCRKRVYPRACGGTPSTAGADGPHFGLSPRVRGNQSSPYARPSYIGSIPARAGEPCGTGHECGDSTVYPRACGGTLAGLC